MANKDRYIKHIKAAQEEIAAARAALQPEPADGDKAVFTVADLVSGKLIAFDGYLNNLLLDPRLSNLDAEVPL